jgi:hypothetical protein
MRKVNWLPALFVAAILSLPSAGIAFGIADKVMMPTWVRWLVSPGYYPGLWYQPSHPSAGFIQGLQNFGTDLSHSISIVLFLNCLYYGAFCTYSYEDSWYCQIGSVAKVIPTLFGDGLSSPVTSEVGTSAR